MLQQKQLARSAAALFSMFCLYLLLGRSREDKTTSFSQSLERANVLGDISNTTLGFQKIFAINLPERTDHRDLTALAAAFTNITIDFVPGVQGEDVPDKVLPGGGSQNLPLGYKGSWRAHMNTLRTVVEQGISTALILEDDADWDIRLREQLQHFMFSSRLSLEALEKNDDTKEDLMAKQIKLDATSARHAASISAASPYGDGWDVLWLGHFEMGLSAKLPYIAHSNDQTVPDPKHVSDKYLSLIYPPKTRLVQARSPGGIGSTAYAVSQSGARKILYHMGIEELSGSVDIMMNGFCRHKGVCVSVVPPLFEQHRPKGLVGGHSDISLTGEPEEVNEEAYTKQIVRGVKVNLPRVVQGRTDYIEQWTDSR